MYTENHNMVSYEVYENELSTKLLCAFTKDEDHLYLFKAK